jgi:hypothetical protein
VDDDRILLISIDYTESVRDEGDEDNICTLERGNCSRLEKIT